MVIWPFLDNLNLLKKKALYRDIGKQPNVRVRIDGFIFIK